MKRQQSQDWLIEYNNLNFVIPFVACMKKKSNSSISSLLIFPFILAMIFIYGIFDIYGIYYTYSIYDIYGIYGIYDIYGIYGIYDMYRVTQKKMIHSVLQLKSDVEVGLNFSTGVSESEFWARSN